MAVKEKYSMSNAVDGNSKSAHYSRSGTNMANEYKQLIAEGALQGFGFAGGVAVFVLIVLAVLWWVGRKID